MNLKRFLILCALVLITLSAQSGELKPALYADPTYPTKSIKEINVIGLDAREDTTLKVEIGLLLGDVFSSLDKKGYKVKGFKTGFAAGFANLKSSVNRLAHGKDTTMSPEDSLRATLILSDLTTNYETWLSNMSETVGNWIFVLVINAVDAAKDGKNYECHSIQTGYLFDREKHSLIWSDRIEHTATMPGTSRSGEFPNYFYKNLTGSEAAAGLMSGMISKKMSQSIAKRGKNFRLPLEHQE